MSAQHTEEVLGRPVGPSLTRDSDTVDGPGTPDGDEGEGVADLTQGGRGEGSSRAPVAPPSTETPEVYLRESKNHNPLVRGLVPVTPVLN